MPLNRNGLMCGVMCRTRVIFQWEGKHMQYPEDIVSKFREAGLKYPSREQHCQVANTWQTECSAEQTYCQMKMMALGQINKWNWSLPSRSCQRSDFCWIFSGTLPEHKHGYGIQVHDNFSIIWHTFQIRVFARITWMTTTHIPHATMTHTRYRPKSMTQVKGSLFLYGIHYGQDPKWIPTV